MSLKLVPNRKVSFGSLFWSGLEEALHQLFGIKQKYVPATPTPPLHSLVKD